MRDKLVQIKVDEVERRMIKTASRRAGETIMGWGRKVLVREAGVALGMKEVEDVEDGFQAHLGEVRTASDPSSSKESWPAPRVEDLLRSSEVPQETIPECEPEPEPEPEPVQPPPAPPAQAATVPLNLIDPLEDLL